MERNVPVAPVATAEQAPARELPARVQEALGELVGAAQDGLLALSVGVGLGVLAELMEEELDEVVGPKGKHDSERVAHRHGHEAGSVTLGGRRLPVSRPRARSADGEAELPLATYAHFADRDPLTAVVLERMLAGVSTRRFARVGAPVGEQVEQEARSTSKSAVSREFVARTRETLGELMSRRLDDVRLAVLMLDGIDLKGRTNVVALGITTDGVKIPLGLWEGSTENAAVATALLSDLVERGLDTSQGLLCVLDGAKALRKAVRDVLGEVPVQRCIRHKERNVLDHLPERERPAVKRRLRRAWSEPDHDRALDGCERPRRRARALASRRRGVGARGPRGDAHPHAAADRRRPEAHARVDQPVRVDDRVRAAHQPQRQALAIGRDGAALDRGRDARGRAPVPAHHRLRGSGQAGRGDRARPRSPAVRLDPDRGGRYARRRLIVTPGPPSKFHDDRDIRVCGRYRRAMAEPPGPQVPHDAGRRWLRQVEIRAVRGMSGRLELTLGALDATRPTSLLIAGDNGSGKSFVVDAIQLALQAEVQTLRGGAAGVAVAGPRRPLLRGSRSVDPPLAPGPLGLAQHELLHLAGRGLGQRAELDRVGALEVREALAAEGR